MGVRTEAMGEAREQLAKLETELVELVEATRVESRPVELDQPIGRLSRMDAIQQQKMAQANRHRAKIRLQQVRAALQRLDQETYGVCVECGEPIGAKRLSVRPESHLCIDCQSEAEDRAPRRRRR